MLYNFFLFLFTYYISFFNTTVADRLNFFLIWIKFLHYLCDDEGKYIKQK